MFTTLQLSPMALVSLIQECFISHDLLCHSLTNLRNDSPQYKILQ
jgi:hypothetical protein